MNRFHYNKEDVIKALRDAGVGEGDILFSHVAALNLGFPEEMADGLSAFDVIFGAIKDVIGEEGSFLTPTYSYSFCKKEIFDPKETKSAVGPFGETFRKAAGAMRSLDPIFSVAGIGPHVEALIEDLPFDCFGDGSVYERLAEAGATLCNFGLTTHYATAMHHVEQKLKAPYRYLKYFTGLVKKSGRLEKQTWRYMVPIMADYSVPMFHRTEDEALISGECQISTIGLHGVTTIKMAKLFELGAEKISKNSWFFAKGPECDIIESEAQRIQNAGMKDQGYIVSDGYDAALYAIPSLKIRQYPTGTEVGDCLVPERWSCKEAYIYSTGNKEKHDGLRSISHSLSIDQVVSASILKEHLYTDAFVHHYYERDWGFCCSPGFIESLNRDEYHVKIDAPLSYGTMKTGELFIQGENDDLILFCANMAYSRFIENGFQASDMLQKVIESPRLDSKPLNSMLFLFVPDVLGYAAYFNNNKELLSRIKGGLFLQLKDGEKTVDYIDHVDKWWIRFLKALSSDLTFIKKNRYPFHNERMCEFEAKDLPVSMLTVHDPDQLHDLCLDIISALCGSKHDV